MKYIESSVLELKEQINADFKKEIIAFANTDGGEIYVGVARDSSVTGVENPEVEMEKIGNMIRDGIKPDLTAYTSIERIEENGKSLIRVSVSRGLSTPVRFCSFSAGWECGKMAGKGVQPLNNYTRRFRPSSLKCTDKSGLDGLQADE